MADTEKTEQPTSKRLSEARRKGNIAKSQDLSAAISILVGFLLLYALGKVTYSILKNTVIFSLGNLSQKDFSTDIFVDTATHYIYIAGKTLFPILGGLLVVGLVVAYTQTGFLFSTEMIKPDLKKLDLVKGAKRLFSMKSLVKLLFSIAKLLVIGSVGVFYIKNELLKINNLVDMSLVQTFMLIVKLTFGLVLRVAAVLVILSILDFIYQKWQHKKGLKMSKKEVKDERKQAEGDPQIKSKIRSAQMQMAMKRMAAKVPTADVVVTNPIHFAVALKYDRETMKAPKVVAKGADLIAFRIKEIAKRHNIPVVEDRALAKTLYKTVDIDKEIPQKLYYAVAKVLSYVYQLKK